MKDVESGEKQSFERDDALASPSFENASECKCSMNINTR